MSDWVAYDFIEKIKSRPTDYFRRNKQVPLVFAAMGVMHQKIDELAQYIYESEDINAATGSELDRFGVYAGIERAGQNDEQYRIKILTQVLSAGYSGTPWQVMRLLSAITKAKDVEIIEMPHAAFSLHTTGLIVPNDISNLIDKSSAVGVKAYVSHDYGTGGFSLAGVDTQSGTAMRVGGFEGMAVADSVALGINRGANFIGGSYIDSVMSITGIEGVLAANNRFVDINEDELIQIGSGFESSGFILNSNLCGVMPG